MLLVGNDEKQIKPISGIVRWLTGDEGVKLTENYDNNDSRPQYLDFVAEAGESLPSKVSRLIEATVGQYFHAYLRKPVASFQTSLSL